MDAADTIRRMAGLATPMTLRVAVTLGLPDRLRGDAVPARTLAAELGVSAVALGRLLDHLVTLDVVARTADGYRTTAFGAHLGADAGNGLTDLLHLDATCSATSCTTGTTTTPTRSWRAASRPPTRRVGSWSSSRSTTPRASSTWRCS